MSLRKRDFDKGSQLGLGFLGFLGFMGLGPQLRTP